MFNTTVVGGFTTWAQDICGALLFGGVAHRFPMLNFAFMEGGAAWACGLYSSVIEKWERRNGDAMQRSLDPKLLDQSLLSGLLSTYGDQRTVQAMPAFLASLEGSDRPEPEGID